MKGGESNNVARQDTILKSKGHEGMAGEKKEKGKREKKERIRATSRPFFFTLLLKGELAGGRKKGGGKEEGEEKKEERCWRSRVRS